MKLISFWGRESNPFYNPALINNGGGYSQASGGAVIELSDGSFAVTEYFDHNCGEFGRDAHISITRLSDGREWEFSFGSNSENNFGKAAQSFNDATGDDLGEAADLTIEAVTIAVGIDHEKVIA